MSALVENECCKCRTKLMRRSKSDWHICDGCWEVLHNEGEVALAEQLERAAVVKYLRDIAKKYANFDVAVAIRTWAAEIEDGKHVP